MDTVNKLRKEFREEQPKMPSGAIVPYEKWMEKKLMDTEKKVEALEDRAEGLQSKSNIFEGMYHTKVKELKKALTQIFEEEVFYGRTSKATLDMIDELLKQQKMMNKC